ncbi:MAG: efflux RND transporter periplasmic adaptor subunit [Rhodopirellula sp.]|nr:efflux RND transporter periplasmic adaptor subunit [Rhodopirellula sp.]
MSTQILPSGADAAPDAGPPEATGSPSSPPIEQPTTKSMPRRFAGWLLHSIPTTVVLAVLAALGWWGHHTGWALPKFSEVTGEAAAFPDDWCEEHGVPETMCVECNPDEYPQRELHGWCKVHGVHECPLHHPDVAQLKVTPEIEARDLDRAVRALALRPRPENNFACQNPGRRIQFASVEAAAKVGVDVEPVLRAPIEESVTATGEIRYDETRVAQLASKVAGTVWSVEKEVGDAVRKGDVLAVIDAVDVGRAKSELLAALAQQSLQQKIYERLQQLAKDGIAAGRQAQEAETEYSKARIAVVSAAQALSNLGLPVSVKELRHLDEQQLATRLRFLGLPASLVAALNSETASSNLIPVRAPFDGSVSSRRVVSGEVISSATSLFTIADTSRMWLMLNIPLEAAASVSIGQQLVFQPDGSPQEVRGTIEWKSSSADQKTRTLMVRASLDNSDGRLLNEAFGAGRVILREEPAAIVVPNAAVQWDGSCAVVFVRDKAWFDDKSPKLFHTRSVRPGVKADDYTEIIAGLLPGEVVATLGSDVLRAQLLKNNLGAG